MFRAFRWGKPMVPREPWWWVMFRTLQHVKQKGGKKAVVCVLWVVGTALTCSLNHGPPSQWPWFSASSLYHVWSVHLQEWMMFGYLIPLYMHWNSYSASCLDFFTKCCHFSWCNFFLVHFLELQFFNWI